VEESSVKVGGNLLKTQPLQSPPDMSPFFLKQYVKTHAHDIFEAYPQLLTEMALRIPYQCKKISEAYSDVGSADFDQVPLNTFQRILIFFSSNM
jgi:E3 ubiquitin-protein ligase UBR4